MLEDAESDMWEEVVLRTAARAFRAWRLALAQARDRRRASAAAVLGSESYRQLGLGRRRSPRLSRESEPRQSVILPEGSQGQPSSGQEAVQHGAHESSDAEGAAQPTATFRAPQQREERPTQRQSTKHKRRNCHQCHKGNLHHKLNWSHPHKKSQCQHSHRCRESR
ncbi:unnamed protein product [Effrenium voratum]|nr:unnamed protein product [Effrenium voratum]